MKLIYREFRKDDIYDIAEIYHLIYNDTRKPEDYIKWLDYPKYCRNFIVENDGKVIGRLLLDQFYFYYPELVNFVIHPKFQGKGIGQHFVSFVIQKCNIADQDSLVIPILKNEYTDFKVRKFYNKMCFLSVIEGNEDLNEWRMNFRHYSLIKALCIEENPDHLLTSSIFAKQPTYFKREYNFNSESKIEMIKHIILCRKKNYIRFKNRANEKVEITIIGQPDQPIGKINGSYCVPGLPPAINGLKLSNNKFKFKIAFRNIKEGGDCELYCRNEGINELKFNLETYTFMNIKISGVPKIITMNLKEKLKYKIKLNIEEKFNPNIFNFASFEAIPLTIIFKNNLKILPPFQITVNFWYRLIDKL